MEDKQSMVQNDLELEWAKVRPIILEKTTITPDELEHFDKLVSLGCDFQFQFEPYSCSLNFEVGYTLNIKENIRYPEFSDERLLRGLFKASLNQLTMDYVEVLGVTGIMVPGDEEINFKEYQISGWNVVEENDSFIVYLSVEKDYELSTDNVVSHSLVITLDLESLYAASLNPVSVMDSGINQVSFVDVHLQDRTISQVRIVKAPGDIEREDIVEALGFNDYIGFWEVVEFQPNQTSG